MPDGTRKPFYTEPGASEEDAEQLRRALLVQLAGTLDDPKLGGTTLGAWGLRWLEERERTHRDAAGDVQRWNAYVAGTPVATRKLSALTPSDVRQWAKSLLARRSERTGELLDRQTVRNAWTTLRAALRAAGEAEHLDAAPLLAVELPRGAIEQEVELEEGFDVLTLEEIDRVLQLELTIDQRSAFGVGLYATLRAGELHGLMWDRCSLEGARPDLVIARSRRGSTKSGSVKRVPLLEPARAALHALWISRGKPTSGLVWPGPKGGTHARGYDWGWAGQRERKRLTPALMKRIAKGDCRMIGRAEGGVVLVEWPGLRERAGIERPITWHEATRHTGASHLLMGSWVSCGVVERAWRLEEVSRMLRHSSLAVTERHYARFLADALPIPMRSEPGPSVGPVGPVIIDFRSHFGELNPGPTVYETVPGRPESLANSDAWDPAVKARQVLEAIAAGDTSRALALATTLAGMVLKADVLPTSKELSQKLM